MKLASLGSRRGEGKRRKDFSFADELQQGRGIEGMR